MKKRTILALMTAMILLILDSRCAAESAREALSLCARTLIPTLFPLFVLGSMLVPALAGIRIPGLSRILGFPEGFFLLGSLGGYPLGAACIAQAAERGDLRQEDIRRMLGLCSLCGPGFLFGVVGAMLSVKAAAVLWLLQIEAALLTAALWPGSARQECRPSAEPVTLPAALNRAISAIRSVCGWVTLAAVAAGFLRQWLFPLLPRGAAVLLTGLLELTNGIFAAGAMVPEQQFVLCGLFSAFGGISVLLQIRGLAPGIPMGTCILQKICHGLLTAGAAWLYLQLGAAAFLVIPAAGFAKIAVEIPGRLVYNVARKEGI